MGISLKGVNLGYMGLDKSLLVREAGERRTCRTSARRSPTSSSTRTAASSGRPASRRGRRTSGSPCGRSSSTSAPVPPEVCLENRLKELGLGPEDFRWVVMGHLHTDHAGGLRIFQDANVDIVVHEDEWRHVESMQEDSENFFAKVDFAFLDGAVADDGVGRLDRARAATCGWSACPATRRGRWACSSGSTRPAG